LDFEIGVLVGKTLAWNTTSTEVTHFKHGFSEELAKEVLAIS